MKKRFVRYNFNMVEIMLAVIVIALGIAGTFVLFPVGVNANKDATANNSIADIAEYVTSFVRAEVLAASRVESNKKEFLSDDDSLKEIFYTSGSGYAAAIDVDNPPGASWEVPTSHENDDNATATLLQCTDEKGVYLVRQLSGPEDNRFVDFAAVARVYRDNVDDNKTGLTGEYFPNVSGQLVKSGNSDSSDDKTMLQSCFLPAVLELSWPATVPLDEREKRYFRFEIFNDHYEIK